MATGRHKDRNPRYRNLQRPRRLHRSQPDPQKLAHRRIPRKAQPRLDRLPRPTRNLSRVISNLSVELPGLRPATELSSFLSVALAFSPAFPAEPTTNFHTPPQF